MRMVLYPLALGVDHDLSEDELDHDQDEVLLEIQHLEDFVIMEIVENYSEN